MEEDELIDKISSFKIIIDNYKTKNVMIENLKLDIEKLANRRKKELQIYIDKYGKILTENQFEEKIRDKVNQIKILEIEKNENYKNLKHIENYFNYKKNFKELETLQKNYNLLDKNNKILRDKLSSTMLFKTKIQEAESIAITNIINSLNNYAKNYLDIFFKEDLINVILSSFKENNKPKINISIYYKGMKGDFKMLSGGEIQRIVLAFNLALNEMFNIPILLLDECTSNLDKELTNNVIDGIKNNSNNKLVLLIAHQVISGIFDNIIKI